MPSGKDPDEAARENSGLFKKAIKEAVPMYDYLLSSAIKRFDSSSSFGKKKISEEYLPVIAKIENSVVRGHYVRVLGTTLGVSDETIEEGLQKSSSTFVRPKFENAPDLPGRPTLTRLERIELYLLSLLIQGNTAELLEEFKAHMKASDITYPPVRRITELLLVYMPSHRIFLVKDFADSLPSELLPTFDEAFLWDISGFLGDEERYRREWDKAVYELERLRLRHSIEAIGIKMHDEALPSDQHDRLQQDLRTLTGALASIEKGEEIR